MISCQLKLKTTKEDACKLVDTMKLVNEICNGLSGFAFATGAFKQYDLHNLCYHIFRDCFNIPSQLLVRAIAKVADSYKLDKIAQRKFKSLGSIKYDCRVLSFKKDYISITTIDGRLNIPFACGKKQFEQLQFQKGESQLIFRDNNFYLHTCCDIPEKEMQNAKEFLGVDRGVNNIASDSLGNVYFGNKVNSTRKKYSKLRKKLQPIKTKSSKRKLAKNKRKESRFAKHINHEISKKIVETAQRHGMGIALEDLKGIRTTTTVRKGNRYIRHSWSFCDLEQKILYKAKQQGIEVRKIDPKNTSRECFKCGHISKTNRKTQSLFLCQVCGHTEHADINASRVISRRAIVNWPIVGVR